MKEKDIILQLLDSEESITFNPALDFKDGVAFVAVSLLAPDNSGFKTMVCLVTSKREIFELDNEELNRRKLYSFKQPQPSPNRWSKKSISEFLGSGSDKELSVVFESITEQINYYVDFGNVRVAELISCWIIGTYFHPIFHGFPYVHLNGNMEAGKSKVLEIVSRLAFNGELVVNSSPAYLTRSINDDSATCCIDELENLQQSKNDDSKILIAMLNSGYKQGAVVGKLEQHGKLGKWLKVRFNSYSAKMFANIKGLDNSLASRCIPITMIRSSDQEIKNREISPQNITFSLIRDDLYCVMMNFFPVVDALYQGISDTEITGREWELWKPILTIAKIADTSGNLYTRLRELAIQISKEKKETTLETFIAPKLIAHLETLLVSQNLTTNLYTAKDIIEYLIFSDEEEFGWLKGFQRPGNWLGKELRKAGIVKGKTIQKKIDGKNTKVYEINLDIIKKQKKAFE